MERESMVFYRSFYEAIVDLPDVELAKAFRAIAEYGLNGKEIDCSGSAKVALKMAKPQIDKNNVRYENGKKGGRPTDKTKEQIDELQRLRHSQQYIRWRDSVYERDCYTCTRCGTKEDIQAHHIKSFDEYPELRFSVENGITLCRSCHTKIHKEITKANQVLTKCEPNVNVNVNDIKKKDTNVSKEKAHFVPPTLENVSGYCREKGLEVDAQHFIDYYESVGWKVGKTQKPMKDWKAALRNWARQDKNEKSEKPFKTRFHNHEQQSYDFEELNKKLFVNS